MKAKYEEKQKQCAQELIAKAELDLARIAHNPSPIRNEEIMICPFNDAEPLSLKYQLVKEHLESKGYTTLVVQRWNEKGIKIRFND